MSLAPQVAVVGAAESLSRCAVGLAGETCGNEINGLEVVCSAVSNVSKPGNMGPVFFEYFCRIIVNLRLPLADHPRLLQAQIQAAYSGEQAAEGEFFILHFPLALEGWGIP